MDDYALHHYTDTECEATFAELFPQGFAGQDVLDQLAPEGWEDSPLVATFHPSLEQVYQETPVESEREVRELVGKCL